MPLCSAIFPRLRGFELGRITLTLQPRTAALTAPCKELPNREPNGHLGKLYDYGCPEAEAVLLI